MSEKFHNIYRIPSSRLPSWDYSRNAVYFVTICTKNRVHFFGRITDHIMVLSEIGLIAKKYWYEIPNHFGFVKLYEFVVMPDHIHGMIIIDKPNNGSTIISGTVETPKLGVSTADISKLDGSTMDISKLDGSTADISKLDANINPTDTSHQKWKSGTLGVIINQYKRICTLHSRQINRDFSWQPRFYDTVIRNHESFKRIAKYIRENPLKWQNNSIF